MTGKQRKICCVLIANQLLKRKPPIVLRDIHAPICENWRKMTGGKRVRCGSTDCKQKNLPKNRPCACIHSCGQIGTFKLSKIHPELFHLPCGWWSTINHNSGSKQGLRSFEPEKKSIWIMTLENCFWAWGIVLQLKINLLIYSKLNKQQGIFQNGHLSRTGVCRSPPPPKGGTSHPVWVLASPPAGHVGGGLSGQPLRRELLTTLVKHRCNIRSGLKILLKEQNDLFS